MSRKSAKGLVAGMGLRASGAGAGTPMMDDQTTTQRFGHRLVGRQRQEMAPVTMAQGANRVAMGCESIAISIGHCWIAGIQDGKALTVAQRITTGGRRGGLDGVEYQNGNHKIGRASCRERVCSVV